MPTRPGQVQLVLEWRNNTVRWEELPPATRGELRTLLRDLRQAAACDAAHARRRGAR